MPRVLSMEEFDKAKALEGSKPPKVLSNDEFMALKQKETEALPKPTYTPFESGLQGALQSGTLGFADEAEGALRGGKDFIKGGNYSVKDLVSAYKKKRDEARQRDKRAQEENPISYGSGAVAGGIASSFIPGLNIAKGATLAGRLGTAAGIGGAMGYGASEGDTLGEDVTSAIKGAALNAGFQGLGETLVPAAKGVWSRLKNVPEDRAVKAVTGQNISALRKMGNTTLQSAGDIDKAEAGLRKVGKDLLDEGSIGLFDKVEDIAPRLVKARGKYGEMIGKIGAEVDAAVPGAVNAQKIADEMAAYASKIPPTEAGKKLQNRIMEDALNFEQMGKMGFEQAQAFKNQFKYKPVDADALISNQDATNKIRNIIGSSMEEAAESVAQKAPDEIKDLLNRYKEVKGKYGSFKKASDAATDRIQKNLSNRFVSPSDYGVGTGAAMLSGIASGGAGAGAIAAGMAGAAANKFARERGSSFAAVTANKMRDILQSRGMADFQKQFAPIINAAKAGDPSSILTFQILKQSYPELPDIIGE